MKAFLSHRSPRRGFHGWGLRIKGSQYPIAWTVCTTREECRDLRKQHGWLRDDIEVVKVTIKVEAVE